MDYGNEDDYMEEEMDDEELQRAIALSMMEVQPGDPGYQPQPAAAPAAAQPAPVQQQPLQAPAAGPSPLAAQLQAVLQQALAQMATAGGQAGPFPAPAPPAAPTASPPAAAAPQPAPAAAPVALAAAPAAPTAKPPAWVSAAGQWAAPSPSQAPCGVLLPGSQASWEIPLKDALSKSLGLPVVLLTGTGQAGQVAAGTVPLQLFGEARGTRLNTAALDTAVSRVAPGADQVLALQGCWLRAAEAAQATAQQAAPAAVGECLALLQSRVVKSVVGVLANDEDDLFFEGGRHRKGFLTGLGNGQVHPAFLEALASSAGAAAEAKLWEGVLRDCFGAFKGFNFAVPEKYGEALRRLDVVTQCPPLRRCLTSLLLREAVAAASNPAINGKTLEASSVLGSLLAATPLPSLSTTNRGGLEFPAKDCFMQLRGYPTSRGLVSTELGSIRRGLAELYKGAHEVCKRVATLKVTEGPLKGREVWPAWLAAACATNVARAAAGSTEAILRDVKAMHYSSSDGFMCGLLATALRFCRPFLADATKKRGALQHLDPAYYSRYPHRVLGMSQERSLAGSMMPALQAPVFPYVSPDTGPEPPHFVAEMFFLTQRLIHVGLMPTVYKSSALAKMLKRQAGGDEEEDEDPSYSTRGASLEAYLLSDSVMAQLMDPDFANDAVQFMELQAMWLVGLMQQGPAAAKAAFEQIPESVVSDMTGWLSYVIRAKNAELFGGMDIGGLMSCLAGLLRNTDLVPSPKAHFGIVSLLLSMLSPQLYGGQRRGALALAGSNMSAAEGALVSAVLGTGATQTELLPAVMKAYAHADHVVALDVDKDIFDKFSMRHSIDLLLMELWKDPACAASLTRVAAQAQATQGAGGAGEQLFADFVGAVLNDLMYLLKDSLGRLEDIYNLEQSMADKACWAVLTPAEQQDKKNFYHSQQHAAAGFMYQAVHTLKMLNTLTAHPEVQRSFLQQPIAGRAANACVHFLDLLVGPRCSQLVVERPEQYYFDPNQLLLDTAHLLLRLAEHQAFVQAVSDVPDYDEGVMQSVLEALATRQLGEYEHRRRLEVLIGAVRQLRGTTSSSAAGGAGPLDLSFPQEEIPELEHVYVSTMEPLAVGDFDSSQPRAYNRHFAELAERVAGDTAAKMKALSREMRNLRGKTQLPIYAASSIFVRYDSDRMDKVRALITGPEGTPYYGGLFFFDVYFPEDYPNVPPLMELETTGGGVARFNPNLYADGKVCLSLLGTWHGGHESEKWKPGTSTLFQVLLSIQGMIFITDPYFNEPAFDIMRGTTEGNSSSLKYNSEIWLNNIRYAMLGVLRHLHPGFEEIITTHFRLLRHRIMQQCAEWLKQAEGMDQLFQKRLRDAVEELHRELAKL